jgi:hypothetical protein
VRLVGYLKINLLGRCSAVRRLCSTTIACLTVTRFVTGQYDERRCSAALAKCSDSTASPGLAARAGETDNVTHVLHCTRIQLPSNSHRSSRLHSLLHAVLLPLVPSDMHRPHTSPLGQSSTNKAWERKDKSRHDS